VTLVEISGRPVGPGEPCFVVAEAGINHDGDISKAHKMIDAAADSGADGVKFQNYRTEDFIADRALTYSYPSRDGTVTESQYEMFKRCELPATALAELRRHCDERGVAFLSTPTSEAGIADLVDAGAAGVKNGSDYLVHLPLIKSMALSGLPTIVSVGMASLSEIDDAVRAYRAAGGADLILLHCTSAYPAPYEDVNLRRIPALASAFDCPVGFSDHTEGTAAAVAAAALGACMVEKHFTLDKSLPGPDHWFSADAADVEDLVDGIRAAETALGSPSIGPTESEAGGRRDSRLSCVAAADLPAGHRLAADDIAFRRPGTGLPPKDARHLVDRVLTHSVSVGHVLVPEDLA
jgi:N,N'-diacetyllegionaminate synthase